MPRGDSRRGLIQPILFTKDFKDLAQVLGQSPLAPHSATEVGLVQLPAPKGFLVFEPLGFAI